MKPILFVSICAGLLAASGPIEPARVNAQAAPSSDSSSATQASPAPPQSIANPSEPNQNSLQGNENTSTESFGQGGLGNNESNADANYAVNMIGEMGGGLTWQSSLFVGQETPLAINIPSPGGGILGRQRIADDDTIFPTDRVFFDYSYFHDAALTAPSDANRFVPGFEKTFFDHRMSVEMRFPMGVQQSTDIVAGVPSFGNSGQFGDIQVILKALVFNTPQWALMAGVDVSVPTAPGVTVSTTDSPNLLTIDNNSTHLLPFVGLFVRPNDLWFSQSFVQIDVPLNGYRVSGDFNYIDPFLGDIYDQTLLFVDTSVGRWIYRDPDRAVRGIAAVAELHYTGSLNNPAPLQTNGSVIGQTSPFNLLDLTVGVHAVIGRSTLSLGYVTPLANDQAFEGEVRCMFNVLF